MVEVAPMMAVDILDMFWLTMDPTPDNPLVTDALNCVNPVDMVDPLVDTTLPNVTMAEFS